MLYIAGEGEILKNLYFMGIIISIKLSNTHLLSVSYAGMHGFAGWERERESLYSFRERN